MEHNEKRQFNGNGHFIVENVAAAKELVKLNPHKYSGREVTLDVDTVEDFLKDPLTNEERKNLK